MLKLLPFLVLFAHSCYPARQAQIQRINHLAAATVRIELSFAGGTGVCTGVVIAHRGNTATILTAAHCIVPGITTVAITYSYRKYPVQVQKSDSRIDLALVTISDAKPIPVSAARIADALPQYFSEVLSIQMAARGPWLPLFGIFVGDRQHGNLERSIFALPASIGSSGSPVLNADGTLISILVGGNALFHHYSLGLTLTQLQAFLNSAKLEGKF